MYIYHLTEITRVEPRHCQSRRSSIELEPARCSVFAGAERISTINLNNLRETPRHILIAAVLGIALLVAFGSAGAVWITSRASDDSYNGTYLAGNSDQVEFTLDTANGPVSASDYRGKLLVLYFGYTHCPDICPLTLSKLSQVQDQLGDDGDDIQVMMISVDPERDTPDILAKYVETFDPSFVGATAPTDQIHEVASDFGIYIEKREVDSAAGYLVDHTVHVIVIDQEGVERIVMDPTLTPEEITSDLEKLL